MHKSAEITAYAVGAEIVDVNQTNNSEFGSTYVVAYIEIMNDHTFVRTICINLIAKTNYIAVSFNSE